MNSKYLKLKFNPPILNVKENAKEVLINTVSVMCDNKSQLKFKKDTNGEFKLYTGIQAYSNFGLKITKTELEWLADEENWQEVFNQINKGYQRVESVRSR